MVFLIFLNPLSANFAKWSNTLVWPLFDNCLSVFGHLVKIDFCVISFAWNWYDANFSTFDLKTVFQFFLKKHSVFSKK